jgi:hypothetical protein
MADAGSEIRPGATDPADPSATGCDPGPSAWLGESDLLVLLESLGVPHSTADLGDDEEAALARLFSAPPDRPDQDNEPDQDDEPAHPRALGDHRDGPEAGEPRTELSSAWIAEHLPVGAGLAGLLSVSGPGQADDFDLPGIAAGYRRLAAWAQAGELAAVAEIAARRAVANPRIGADEDGRPRWLPPEAAAEVALELRMTQLGAAGWADLACQLRWRLPGTAAALSAGTIDR